VGHDFDYYFEGRLDDEIKEANLSLSNVGSVSIKHLADSKALLLFEITLLEKFNKEKLSPVLADVPALSGVGDVCNVEH